jgi:hypothetical protein
LPALPTISLQNKDYSRNKISAKATVAREEYVIPNPFNYQAYKGEDSGDDNSLDSKEYRLDPYGEDSTQVVSGKERAQSRLIQESHFSRRLNARDRRKLLALKGEKMTLRQIGSQFAHLDTDFLRQV